VIANPLTELPVIGPVVELMDKPLSDAGVSLWLAQAAELLVVGSLSFALLRIATRSVLPWILAAAVGPTVALLGALRILLLLPQLAVTTAYDRLQRAPARAVYAYGHGVMDLTEALEAGARRALPQCRGIRRLPGLVLIGLLLALFALWNNNYCGSDAKRSCVSPVARWVDQL
jgi:hypothetical protein